MNDYNAWYLFSPQLNFLIMGGPDCHFIDCYEELLRVNHNNEGLITIVILIKQIMCSGFYMVYTRDSQNLVCITIMFVFFLNKQIF